MRFRKLRMLLNQTWSTHPMCNRAFTWVVVKQSPEHRSRRMGHSSSRDPKSSMAFSVGFSSRRERIVGYGSDWLVESPLDCKEIQP